ncbi:peptide-methionine (S)-S-oxide reductase [Seonamhaeicola sp.]|uniref:peptide-methionine (S)-S-oxide reductase n=1 Tax=Seonamhaeicola sp. TaxID=1912245 RepID=UPI00260A3A18|nr:peptide-methionine (S)-S-oxide reductase [Seonamhaeicola sp.]
MNSNLQKIALGGGCHWCTEAVFQSLKGVKKVEQGYVSYTDENESFSEAVMVHYDPKDIQMETLVEIHLHTHKSTSNHSFRDKYRSAVYIFSEAQEKEVKLAIEKQQKSFENKIVTGVLPFVSFKPSREQITNYYYKNPDKPFCETFINPKLKLLLSQYSKLVLKEKLNHLEK